MSGTMYTYDLLAHHHKALPQNPLAPQFSEMDWLQGWRRWAESRKRGKMAQFTVDLLEKGVQGRWMDITVGKFELTEWHNIAQYWYKKKKRASDSTDAPCMLRKGLPRAFPNLEEVKSESVKDGTQYKSRVFQCPAVLVQEVMQIMSGQGCYTLVQNPLAECDASSEDDEPIHNNLYDVNDIDIMHMISQSNGISVSPQLLHRQTENMYDHGEIKQEFQHPWSTSPISYGPSPTHSPHYTSADHHLNGGLLPQDQQWFQAQQQQQVAAISSGGAMYSPRLDSQSYLEVPVPVTPVSTDSRRSSLERSATLQGSYPNSPPMGSPQMMGSTQMIGSTQMMTAAISQVDQRQVEPVLMPIKLLPNQSPLEGGGEIAVVFSRGFPDGQKTVVYWSPHSSSYFSRVEAMQENAMTLSAMIPRHQFPEEVEIQVFCNSQIIACAPFTYYQGANYDAAQMLQYLSMHMPQFFSTGLNPEMLGGSGQGGQERFAHGGGSYGNPAYMLLIGACKSGIEPLVRPLLQMPGVGPLLGAPIPGHNGSNVADLAKQNGHTSIANCISELIKHSVITARLPSGIDPIEKLEKGGNTPQESATCVMHALKAVREGQDASLAISNFISQSKKATKNATKKTDGKVVDKLATNFTKIVLSEASVAQSTQDTVVTVEPPTDTMSADEIKAMKEENERLKEAYDAMKEEHSAKIRECKKLAQERDMMGKKMTDLERELEDKYSPSDHSGQLYRAQSDMTITSYVKSRGAVLNLNKPKLIRQTHSIDPHKNPPLALTQNWLSKESGISMSMEEEASNFSGRRRSSLISLISERAEGNEVTMQYSNDDAKLVAETLFFDTMHIITEDWPPADEKKMFRAGERLLEIDGQPLRNKTLDDVVELLKQASPVKKILKQIMPPVLTNIANRDSDIHLDASKIDDLLAHFPPSSRPVTLTQTSSGLPFKLEGGNAVGLFVMDVQCSGILPGDQIIQINGESTANMTYEEAITKLKSSTQLNLEVLYNQQAWESQRLQQRFELDSAVYKCQASYTPDKANTATMKDALKEMELTPGTMVHVINTSLYEESGYWLAWKLSPEGHKIALKKIPNATKVKDMYGDVGKLYERISVPICAH